MSRSGGADNRYFLFLLLTAAYVAWTALRSIWLDQGRIGIEVLGTLSPALIALAITIPAAISACRLQTALWLFGASASYMFFPSVPHVPFLTETGHVMAWTIIAGTALGMMTRQTGPRPHTSTFGRPDVFVLLFALFWLEGAIALALRLLIDGDAWEAKVGAAQLIRYFSLLALAHILTQRGNRFGDVLRIMEEGTKTGIAAAIVLGYLGILIIFLTEPQPFGDSAWGFGYWTRLKSTFPGPESAGNYYAAVIPFVFLFHSRQSESSTGKRLGYAIMLVSLYLLIIATGTRNARLAALLPLAAALSYRPYRSLALRTLPFVALIYFIGFYFRSLPEALSVFWGSSPVDESHAIGMTQNFFNDPERVHLASSSIAVWLSHPLAVVLGYGTGLNENAGIYRLGPHSTLLSLAMEQGLVGLAIIGTAMFILLSRLSKAIRAARGANRSMYVSLITTLLVIGIGGLTHDTVTWSYVWFFLLMALVAGRPPADREICSVRGG